MSSTQEEVMEAALGRGRVFDDGAERPAAHGSEGASRAFLRELLERIEARDETSARRDAFPAATALGVEWFAARAGLADVAREAGRLGHGLEQVLAERGLSAEERRGLRTLVDEAVARAVDGYAAAERRRRDRWLSYLAHEMRNSLNTLVNATWILRNTDNPNQVQKVSDMSERAIRRLEEHVKNVRELEGHLGEPIPGRPEEE